MFVDATLLKETRLSFVKDEKSSARSQEGWERCLDLLMCVTVSLVPIRICEFNGQLLRKNLHRFT